MTGVTGGHTDGIMHIITQGHFMKNYRYRTLNYIYIYIYIYLFQLNLDADYCQGLLYQVPGEAGTSPHGPQRVDLALTLITFS